MTQRPMTAVTDVRRGGVGVEIIDDDDEDVGATDAGRFSDREAGPAERPAQGQLNYLKNSVVARLLMDGRPSARPLHSATAMCHSNDLLLGLKSLRSSMDLPTAVTAAGKPVSTLIRRQMQLRLDFDSTAVRRPIKGH